MSGCTGAVRQTLQVIVEQNRVMWSLGVGRSQGIAVRPFVVAVGVLEKVVGCTAFQQEPIAPIQTGRGDHGGGRGTVVICACPTTRSTAVHVQKYVRVICVVGELKHRTLVAAYELRNGLHAGVNCRWNVQGGGGGEREEREAIVII